MAGIAESLKNKIVDFNNQRIEAPVGRGYLYSKDRKVK
jgi:hypothetical protein